MGLIKTPQEKAQKMYFNNLDNIYNTSKSICDEWETKMIVLEVLKVIINESKPKLSGDANVDKMIKAFNTTLDSLYLTMKKISKSMHSKSVPLTELANGIVLIKDAFKTGLN